MSAPLPEFGAAGRGNERTRLQRSEDHERDCHSFAAIGAVRGAQPLEHDLEEIRRQAGIHEGNARLVGCSNTGKAAGSHPAQRGAAKTSASGGLISMLVAQAVDIGTEISNRIPKGSFSHSGVPSSPLLSNAMNRIP